MAIFQELTGQGRVVGGHLATGTVVAGGAGPFSKNNDLSIQHASNPFKRHRINADTITEWEEIQTKEGLAGAVGRAAAGAAIPGRIGKAVGAGLGAAVSSGHTVRVIWADGKQSIIELPEKQFMVMSVILKDLQIVADLPVQEVPESQPGVGGKFADLAASVLGRSRAPIATADTATAPDPADQIAKLAALHAQGILTDTEFADKKAELLRRL
ncbi:SHOCT domain-containing protein [Knoellia flava]|uniref:SHOCT domain-containing protein n=1 Tax=Knoellia flava TaxID=913969 RepID=UPI0018DDF7B1|nr:SHOCT domain-containing protein [Knoellia flava]